MKMKIQKLENRLAFVDVDPTGQIFAIYTPLQEPQKAYELIKQAMDYEKNSTDHSFLFEGNYGDLEMFVPAKPHPVFMEVDFRNLKGKVYSQYGEVMDLDITFTIEGTDKAKIEDHKIIEESVDIDTPYTIIAKVEDITERRENIIKAVDKQEILLQELKSKVEEQQGKMALQQDEIEQQKKESITANAKIKALTDDAEFKNDLIQEMALMLYA